MSRKAVRWESHRQASSRCSQRPLVLVADDVFPRFVYAVITMETAAMDTPNKRLRWSRGSVLAFGTQVRGFTPGRSCRIFRGKKSSARLSSEGK
jgi:hypothetical protein